MISQIHAFAQKDQMGIAFTNRNENEIKEYDDNENYVPYNKEDIEDNGSDHPYDGSTINNGDDYSSDDDGPEQKFSPATKDDGKSTESHHTK